MYTILKTFLCYLMSTQHYFTSTVPPPTAVIPYEETPIFGGNEIQPEFSQSYIVNIINNNTNCNGVLLDPYTVLTAGSCVDESFYNYKILFHQHNQSRPFEEEGVLIRYVDEIIFHPNIKYSHTGIDIWNVALLKFKEKVNYNPIQLDFNVDIDEKYLAVVGWGNTAKNGSPSDVLRGTSGILSISNRECSSKMSDIRNHMLCIDGRDVCSGNKGAALTLAMSNVLVGISSWSHLCGSAGHVGIYTRVSALQDWLKIHQIQQ